jgi:putative nucleotidyltransferase with HDIG domain
VIGRLRHLVRRSFGVLRAQRLGPREQAEVARWLRPAEREVFWQQTPADQRHALACARAVVRRSPDRADLARAALLHDVGKALTPLGVIRRALATGLSLAHLPTPGRLRAYLAHGERGAEALQRGHAEPVVVAYARHHHGTRPAAVPAEDWDLLTGADRA